VEYIITGLTCNGGFSVEQNNIKINKNITDDVRNDIRIADFLKLSSEMYLYSVAGKTIHAFYRLSIRSAQQNEPYNGTASSDNGE